MKQIAKGIQLRGAKHTFLKKKNNLLFIWWRKNEFALCEIPNFEGFFHSDSRTAKEEEEENAVP